MANILLGLLVCILTAPMSNAAHSILIVSSIVFLAGHYFRNRDEFNLKYVPKEIYISFFVFVLGLFVSSLALGDKASIKGSYNYLYWMLTFFVVFYLNLQSDSDKAALYGFSAGILISFGFAAFEFFTTKHLRLRAFYASPNHLASVMAMALPFAITYFINLRKSAKINAYMLWVFFSILAGIWCLLFTGSRGGIIGAGAGSLLALAVYTLKHCLRTMQPVKLLRNFVLILLVILLPVGLLYVSKPKIFTRGGGDLERKYMIESSYNMWNDHKVFGVGLSNWQKQYLAKYILPKAKERQVNMPHNIFALFFSTTGLVGGLCFCAFLLGILTYLVKNLYALDNGGMYCFAMLWAFFAIGIHGLVDVGISSKTMFKLFCGILGLAASGVYKYNCKNLAERI